jgi:Ca-activated chloride channel homolog
VTFVALWVCLLAAPNKTDAQNPPFPAPPPPSAGSTQTPAQNQSDNKDYRIRSESDLVVLRATVLDQKGEFVPNLKPDNFRVYEDKIEQKISLFQREDIPVSMGLVIDNSGSMREKRAQVNAAALTLVQTSNPQDEVFVVNFNDEFYLDLDKDFTNDTKELKEALERIDSRGSTALYDAVIGSLDHLKKGHKDKKVLLVITDGDDDASRKSFEYTVQAAQQSNGIIYAIGVFSDEDRKSNKRMVRHSKKILATLAETTGGSAYFPDNLAEVNSICTQIARDIRNQYTLGYYPTNTAKDGSFRNVHVDLIPPKGSGKLSVRTRTGYYAQKPSSAD